MDLKLDKTMDYEDISDYFSFSQVLSKEEYMLIKKYAVKNGKKLNDKFPRIYEFEFMDLNGFSYMMICLFDDKKNEIVSFYDLKSELENNKLPRHSYALKDINDLMEIDDEKIQLLLEVLKLNK